MSGSNGLKRKAPTDLEPSQFEQELQRIHQEHGLRNSLIII